MKNSVMMLICIALLAFAGCMQDEPAYEVSVTSVEPGDLADYEGTGSNPTLKDDILAGAMPGIMSLQVAVTGVMADPDFQNLPETRAVAAFLNGLVPGSSVRSIEGNLDTTMPDVSGNISIIDEPIVIEEQEIGTVNSFIAGFSGHMSSSSTGFSMNAQGELTAALSINTFAIEGYTVADGKINAAAKAKIDIEASSQQTASGPVLDMSVDYNIGAGLSAGFSVSSDEFAGKYIIEFSYSAKKAFSINASNPSEIIGDLGITVTIKVYDNNDTLITMETYDESDVSSFVVIETDPIVE